MPWFASASDDFFRWMQLVTVAMTIGFARFYGFTFVFPLFSWMQVKGMMRFAIALGLSAPAVMLVYGILRDGAAPTPALWAALVAKEVAVGAVLGAILGLPFFAMQGMGDAIDVYRGGSAANLYDPVHAQEMTISGTLLVLLSLAMFVTLGGIAESVDLLLRSHTAWPALSLAPKFEWERLRIFGEIGARGLSMALVIIAPLLIVLLLVDVALVFTVRGARAFQIYELTQAVRGLVLLMVLPVYVILFESHFSAALKGVLQSVRNALSGLAG